MLFTIILRFLGARLLHMSLKSRGQSLMTKFFHVSLLAMEMKSLGTDYGIQRKRRFSEVEM